MQGFTLSGVSATITLDDNGVTIKHSLTRRSKTIAWTDIGGVHIQAGSFLTRPKLFVVSKREAAYANSDFRLLKDMAGSEAADWFVVVPMGQDQHFAALKDEIVRRATQDILAANGIGPSMSPGDAVLVAWSDGQRYSASLRALHGKQALVVFPNGSEQWVGREHVSRP